MFPFNKSKCFVELLYIPFWIYSNVFSVVINSILFKLYIPFWIYSNEAQSNADKQARTLYIPFWIYSNTLQDDTGEQSITFTFHSGYIPIK